MIRNIAGAPVTNEDFYGRKKEIRSGLNKIENGNSLMLSAPRRVGKTSFSKKMIECLEKEGWVGIFINLEGLRTEKGLYTIIVEKLNDIIEHGKIRNLVLYAKRALEQVNVSINSVDIKLGCDDVRRTLYDDILKIVNNEDNPIKLLFVFDELAVFLNNITNHGANPDEAVDFLNGLRSLRQECHGRAVWIFCSSISIENYLMTHHLSASMNDVLQFPLGPMPKDEALGLISELAEGAEITIPRSVQQYILERLGLFLPHNIQGIFSVINDNAERGDKITNKAVDAAYNQLLANSPHLNAWKERLSDYDKLAPDLKRILRLLCRQNDFVSVDGISAVILSSHEDEDEEYLRSLLSILVHDGYIYTDSDGRYSFRMLLLKDYWKRNNL